MKKGKHAGKIKARMGVKKGEHASKIKVEKKEKSKDQENAGTVDSNRGRKQGVQSRKGAVTTDDWWLINSCGHTT